MKNAQISIGSISLAWAAKIMEWFALNKDGLGGILQVFMMIATVVSIVAGIKALLKK